MRQLTVILSNFILQSFYLLIPLAHSLIGETHNLSLTSVICRKRDCKSLFKMSGHFERPNQNDRYKLGARKNVRMATSAEIYKTHKFQFLRVTRSVDCVYSTAEDPCLQMP